MIRAALDARRLLFLGAHCDDIEIGCGGTVLKLLAARRDVEVLWVVLSSTAERRAEALASARLFLAGAAAEDVRVRGFRDGYFPFAGAEIKDYFEDLRRAFAPDVIFTHHREDRHQDHRLVSDLTWSTWRDALILEYEIPKWDGDLGRPSVFSEIDEALCARKLRYLAESFPSQAGKHWFGDDTFRALMRLRGVECAARSRLAEAFHCRKLVFGA